MSERQGVEIDYCPACRGVWLDRGELDKILERMQQDASVSDTRRSGPRGDADSQIRYVEPRAGDGRSSYDSGKAYRKKSSPFEFLGDLFG